MTFAGISALFVRPDGPYPTLVSDWWGGLTVRGVFKGRDARNYDGNNVVVLHPPCQRWGKLWWSAQHLGKGLGDDDGCFASSVDTLLRVGGVLEHPEGSKAFAAFGVPKPASHRWQPFDFGYVAKVSQRTYGHRAEKMTWLWWFSLDADRRPPDLLPPIPRKPGEPRVFCVSGPGPSRTAESRKRHAIKLMGKRERELTPRPFAVLLCLLAAAARP